MCVNIFYVYVVILDWISEEKVQGRGDIMWSASQIVKNVVGVNLKINFTNETNKNNLSCLVFLYLSYDSAHLSFSRPFSVKEWIRPNLTDKFLPRPALLFSEFMNKIYLVVVKLNKKIKKN